MSWTTQPTIWRWIYVIVLLNLRAPFISPPVADTPLLAWHGVNDNQNEYELPLRNQSNHVCPVLASRELSYQWSDTTQCETPSLRQVHFSRNAPSDSLCFSTD